MCGGVVFAQSAGSLDQATYDRVVSKAIDYLKSTGQAPDGSYSKAAGIGPTALVTTALLRHGVPADDPAVARSLEYLESFVQEDGGIYQPGSFFQNYETAVTVVCLAAAGQDKRFGKVIERADKFLKGIQWAEDDGKTPADPEYGGGGYGQNKRPDLSNTSFLIDALRAAGNGEDSEAVQRALLFVSRCQNLESEHNTTEFASKVNDGGFYYTVAAGGSSPAGETADGGLRSYGAMTYSGLKSMLYAGVDADDPRVTAALAWIRRHYDLDSNPGMGDAGLYYYYHVFAKALGAVGESTLTDDAGQQHDWRAELLAALAERQRPDGSWSNSNERWMEGDPNLATGFALLALSYCRPDATRAEPSVR